MRGATLARAFWIVAGGDLLLALAVLLKVATGTVSEYDWIVEIVVLGFMAVLGTIMGIVALVRRPAAYGIGLALAVWPPLYYGGEFVVRYVTTPSAEALQAGHGYFKGASNRALADAIVAGDAPKVVSLLPTANPNATGWNDMTMMRLALEDGHANPQIVAALLKAGADPDQDDQILFGFMTTASEEYGDMIEGRNEPLLRAVIDSGVDLNQRNLEGNPRFFSGLKWPEGLAIMLDHGADPEARDKDGNTAIMWAVMLRYWPSIDVLLAHGARIDCVDHDGKSLRDIVLELRGRDSGDIPPQLASLSERLQAPP